MRARTRAKLTANDGPSGQFLKPGSPFEAPGRDRERAKRLCYGSGGRGGITVNEDTPSATYFDQIQRKLSWDIKFYIAWVDRFQASLRPFYEKIYFAVRKQLFDFFGKDVEAS